MMSEAENRDESEKEAAEPEGAVALLPDWSVRLSEVMNHDGALKVRFEASGDELARVEAALRVEGDIEVRSLVCDCVFEPMPFAGHKKAGHEKHDAVRGQFHFRAGLMQTCVITLERINTGVEDSFSQTFAEAALLKRQRKAAERESPFAENQFLENPFDEEPPLPIEQGCMAFGALVYEYLATGVDPNPRKPGVVFGEPGSGDRAGEDDRPPSPFAILKTVKGVDKREN